MPKARLPVGKTGAGPSDNAVVLQMVAFFADVAEETRTHGHTPVV